MMDSNDVQDGTDRAPTRQLYKTIFEHANDAIFVVDFENDSIVDCNPAAADLVEFSREELRSMPASDLHPHNLPEFMDFAEDVLAEGQGWTDDITCYCKSGDIIPAEMSASIVDVDGRPHLVNHIRQTGDRHGRKWFEALIEQSGDLVTVVKPDGNIRYQSPSIANVLGYEPEQVVSESLQDYVHPDDCDRVEDLFEELTNTEGKVTERREFRIRHRDGSWAWLEAIGSHRPDSTVSGYIINSRDISARKQSQQQAAVLQRLIRHNLRNRLNVIMGRASTIAESSADEVADAVETIVESAAKLRETAETTQVLSDFIEAPRIEQTEHNVSIVLEDAVERLRETYPGVSFECTIPEDKVVTAGPKLDVALAHVLENAAEHNDASKPVVTVAVEGPSTPDGYVRIRVGDNGPGIPKQERAVLLEGRETPLNHGSGLGLWIVNWIVNRSGGTIEFQNSQPRGSRVSIGLPSKD